MSYMKPKYTRNPIFNQPKSALTHDSKWSSGFCECCTDCKSCCFSLWCWPCFQCYLDSSARECPCTSFGLTLLGYPFAGVAILRSKVRAAFNINGSILDDCWVTALLPCCSALQVYRELEYQGEILN